MFLFICTVFLHLDDYDEILNNFFYSKELWRIYKSQRVLQSLDS